MGFILPFDKNNTTIQVKPATRRRLKILCAMKDFSYDELINWLLDRVEES